MWNRLRKIWPDSQVWRRSMMVTAFSLLVALAFVWGRFGGQRGEARPPEFVDTDPVKMDYSKRVVAYIYGSIPITREELGEYLIARYGAERLKFLVHRRIVELACRKAGIFVTDEEVNARFEEDLRAFKMTDPKEFQQKILSRWNKTVYEWREDVIRPKLALTKFCQSKVRVTETDLRDAFEAKYGPKVQCRMIVLPKTIGAEKYKIYEKVRDSEANFSEYAKKQFMAPIAAKAGKVPPIHKHFGDKKLEKVAFALRPGEVSELIGMKDGTSVILKCDEHIPPDTSVRFEDERLALHDEVKNFKLNRMIPQTFRALKKDAQPKIFEDEVVPRGSLRVARRRPGAFPQTQVMPAPRRPQPQMPPQTRPQQPPIPSSSPKADPELFTPPSIN